MSDLHKAAEMALGVLLDPKTRADEVAEAVKALRQALDDKPPVKSYCGGKPNYCTPQPEVCCGEYARCLKVCIPKERWFAQQKLNVDAVNMSQDRVDETAKGEHDLWIAAACLKSTVEAAIKAGDWKVDGACDPTMDLQYLANCFSSIQNREWVGLTDEDVHDAFNYVEMVKLLDFDRDRPEWCEAFASACEATLRHRNGEKQ